MTVLVYAKAGQKAAVAVRLQAGESEADAVARLRQTLAPDNAITVADADFPTFADPQTWVVDWQSGTIATTPRDTLASAKAEALAAIDAAAESARLLYITAGAGQSMTYDAKQLEAREILFDAASTAAADAMDSATLKSVYPMIWASIPATGATPSAVATAVQAQALAWAAKGAEIEKARLDAKAAVQAAVTSDQVAAAKVVVWP